MDHSDNIITFRALGAFLRAFKTLMVAVYKLFVYSNKKYINQYLNPLTTFR